VVKIANVLFIFEQGEKNGFRKTQTLKGPWKRARCECLSFSLDTNKSVKVKVLYFNDAEPEPKPFSPLFFFFQLGKSMVGGSVQRSTFSHGVSPLGGSSPSIFSALTNTGITCPVPSLNFRWPRTKPISFLSPVSMID